MNYINILLISAIWVFLLDISGAWQELTAIVSGWLTNGRIKKPFSLKPFSCSLCMTFWTGLAYILFAGCFTLPMMAYVCLVAMLTPRLKDLLITIDLLIARLFEYINTKLR